MVAERRRQLATARKTAGYTQERLAAALCVDVSTVQRWEAGTTRPWPYLWPKLAKLLGVSKERLQELLADEDSRHGLPARPETAIASELVIGDGRSNPPGGRAPGDTPQLRRLRRSLLGQGNREANGDAKETNLHGEIAAAHRSYQQANYDGAADLLPSLIDRLEGSAVTIPPRMKADAYLAAAKLATKMGDAGLAWVAADRCLRFAMETGQQGLIGVANYQVACALLTSGYLADAEETAARAVEPLARCSRTSVIDIVSAHGSLLLLMAITSALQGEAQKAQRDLRLAAQLAERLGRDGNWSWTAFGPTNVAIHDLAVHVALGDSRKALQLGECLDTDALPVVLRGRRSQVHLELGWASAEQGDDTLATLHLLEAERVAKQSVSRNATARALLGTLLARERKGGTPGLRALAGRAGVA